MGVYNIFTRNNVFNITSPYGPRTVPVNDWHTGEDWGTGSGTYLFSIRPGGIINHWYTQASGWKCTITYNDMIGKVTGERGVRFEFWHCQDPTKITNSGDKIKSGDTICLTGATGTYITGPHVHIQVHEGAHITEQGVIDKVGRHVDPKSYTTDQSLIIPEESAPDYQKLYVEEKERAEGLEKQVEELNATVITLEQRIDELEASQPDLEVVGKDNIKVTAKTMQNPADVVKEVSLVADSIKSMQHALGIVGRFLLPTAIVAYTVLVYVLKYEDMQEVIFLAFSTGIVVNFILAFLEDFWKSVKAKFLD